MSQASTTKRSVVKSGSGRQPRVGVSRAALWRVREIHRLIQSGKYPNCATLARLFEKDQKTILRDIDHMRNDHHLPIEYDKVKHGYYYTVPTSEFPLLELSRGELVALFVAEKAVEPLKGTRLHKLVHDSIHKIAEACPEFVSLRWQDLDEAFSMKATGGLKSSVEVFTALVDAVLGQSEISFDYQKSPGSKKERRQVQPYHVGQLQNGWYLIANDLLRKDKRTFALQRMSDLKILKTKFKRDPAFNIRDYLGSGFGVWSYGSEVERFEVCIRFTGWAARYVAERQWHASQKITPLKEDGSEIEFRAEVAGLEEITRWVLGHGRYAKVIGPEALRKAVQAEARAMLEK